MRGRRIGDGVLVALTLLGSWACGEGEGGGGEASGISAESFCPRAMARVDSFISLQERENPVPDDPRYGGSAVISGGGEIAGGLNPLVSEDLIAAQVQAFSTFMTVIRYDEEIRPVPYLAESWDVAEDTSSITFHLRDDVFWHDGERTTADDVAFTYLRATDPETAFPNPAYWDHYVKGSDGVDVVDDYTVRVHLQEPHAEFLDPWRALAIAPEHLLADVPPGELRQHPYGTRCVVGNGPYAFVRHRPQESWTFRANPGFPEALGGRPYLDRYVYRVIPEPTTQLTELLTGRTDVYIAPPPSQAEEIREAPDVELRHFVYRDYVFVAWNARREVLSDRRVRHALTMGTDRDAIVDALLEGYGQVAQSSVPPFHWAYDPSIEDALTHDPEAARALLTEAGWVDRDGDGVRENADGEPLAISIKYNQGNQIREQVAELMQAQLAEIGVQVTPEVVEYATLIEQLSNPDVRDFDGVVMGFVTEFKVNDRDLFHSSQVDARYAFSGTRSPELDRLLDTLQLVLDRDAARELWHEYQETLVSVQPFTFLYFRERLDGVSTRLQNVTVDIRGELVNIDDWWIDPATRRGGSGASR